MSIRSFDDLLFNAINGAQVLEKDGTVDDEARIVFGRSPVAVAIAIPRFQSPGAANQPVTRTVTVKNLGEGVLTVNYEGGTIEGQRAVQLQPGEVQTFSSIPPKDGGPVVEFAIISPKS